MLCLQVTAVQQSGSLGAQQRERGGHLVAQDRYRALDPGRAAGRERPVERPPDERSGRAQCKGHEDVQPGPDATVHPDLDPARDRIDDRRQRVSCCDDTIELARAVHLSPSPCLARVRRLEQSGYIKRYVTLLDTLSLGLTVSVFIQVRLERQVESALEVFEREIAARPEVMECYLMTGDSDYLIRVVVADIAALERFILDQLTPIADIEKIRSSFALKQVRYKTALPLPVRS